MTIYLLLDVKSQPQPNCDAHFLSNKPDAPLSIDGDIESSLDVYQRNALLLQKQPQYILFASSRSMTRTLTYYNQRQFEPANIDYSKLLRGCRETDVTYTLMTKASIDIHDLTDDVKIIESHPSCFGSFADVWKGIWKDRHRPGDASVIVCAMRNACCSQLQLLTEIFILIQVAVKVIRAQLVGYAHDRVYEAGQAKCFGA